MRVLGLLFLGALGCSDAKHPDAVEAVRLQQSKDIALKTPATQYSAGEFLAFWRKDANRNRDQTWEEFQNHAALVDRALGLLEEETPDIQMARKRAMIRLMLREEVETTKGELTEEARLLVNAENRIPAGLRASHILVTSTTDTPVKERGAEIAKALRETFSEDVDALDLVRFQREFEVDEGMRLHVDLHMVYPQPDELFLELPTGWTNLDPKFVKATIDLGGPGVTQPFETQFGWHIAVVHEVLDAVELTPEEVEVLAQHRVDTEARTEVYKQLYEREKSASHYNTYPRVIRERLENQL